VHHSEETLHGKLEYLMEDVDADRVYDFEMRSPQIADTGTHFLIENTLEEIGSTALFRAESRLRPEGCTTEITINP